MMTKLTWNDIPETYDENLLSSWESLFKVSFENPPASGAPILSFPAVENLLIEADNYAALDYLVRAANLSGKINIIYIDPPYNTGNSFTYNDNFSSGADYHSGWLSFMQRRLNLAHQLLADSGCIFIAISQEELYVLKLLCDQIFGEQNFVNDFMWLHGKGKKDQWSRTLQQHTLCYAKNKTQLKSFTELEYSSWAKKNVDNDPRGNWFSGSISFTEQRSNPKHKYYYSVKSPSGKVWTRQWMVSKTEMEKLLSENKIFFGSAPEYSGVPRIKIFNDTPTEVIPRNIIDCVESTRAAQKHLDELLGEAGVFDNPKPVDLISHLIEITGMPKDSLILDFFAGSGTTFEAVCDLNGQDGGTRKCILIQKPEETWEIKDSKKIPRRGSEKAFSAGFNTISDICWCRCQKVSVLYNQPVNKLKLNY